MNTASFIKQHQSFWARRRGISVDEKGYVQSLDENLFDKPESNLLEQFHDADGGELQSRSGRAKMHALHSSSALAVNVFAHWIARTDKEPIAKALQIPSRNIAGVQFEMKAPIASEVDRGLFPKDPNIDVVFRYENRSDKLRAVGIESKFGEAYGQHDGMRDAYFQDDSLWRELPHCRALALETRGIKVSGLNIPQLLKHTLALKHLSEGGPFWLVYLWYAGPTDELGPHFDQLKRFQTIIEADGGRFHFMTYQELICRLEATLAVEHHEYMEYLAERYL